MAKSTTARAGDKPKKPRPDFPLYIHATGRWCKRVRGKLHYFGKYADDSQGEAALKLWLDRKDDLLTGRTPRRKDDDGLTVAELCNHFLTFKQELRASGELAPRTFDRYYRTCDFVVSQLGKQRSVKELRPDDFQRLRAVMAKRWGAVALGNEIQMVRSIFRYGYESELIDKPVRFGPGFKKPSAKVIRQTRVANGPRMFSPEQIRKVLDHATTNMRAMVLLGINGGLGNTDLAAMPLSVVDLESEWLDYARAKTAIPRRIPLWIESTEAIRKAIAERKEPADSAAKGLLFIGRRGQSYLGKHKGYRVTQEFDRVAKLAGVEGRTFYDLRRTFQTIGEGAADLVAVQSILGHAASGSDMSAIYRQRVGDDRLQSVAEHVRAWLFGESESTKPSQSRLRVVG